MSINPYTTALMPISQAISWYLVLNSKKKENDARPLQLYTNVSMIAAFYCSWALAKKVFQGDKKDLGHYSMGALALASFFQRQYLSVAGTGLVLLNFSVPAYFCAIWDAKTFAAKVKGSDSKEGVIWAYIFKGYVVSSLCLWSTVLTKLLQGGKPKE